MIQKTLKTMLARIPKQYDNEYLEYQKDLKYPTKIELKLIHKDKKLYIIEVK